MNTPARFDDVAALEEFMTRPSAPLIEDMTRVAGDIVVLGVGGKMGPTLARMAKRAAPGKRVIGVARFSAPLLRSQLESHGIECISADLLDRRAARRAARLRERGLHGRAGSSAPRTTSLARGR